MYVVHQTLAHLSYSSYVSWTSACPTRMQRFLSVQASIGASRGQYLEYTPKGQQYKRFLSPLNNHFTTISEHPITDPKLGYIYYPTVIVTIHGKTLHTNTQEHHL